jgi:N,N'-diacetylchitobiose transport system permease protein
VPTQPSHRQGPVLTETPPDPDSHPRTAVTSTPGRSSGPGSRTRSRRPLNAQVWRPWLLLAPTFVVLGLLLFWPLVRVAVLSFQDFQLRNLIQGNAPFIGFGNYSELLHDPLLWHKVLPNTVVFAAVCVVLTVVVGTLVALLLARLGPWTRGLVTSAIMVAWAVPAVTGTYVWIFLFDSRSGAVMRLLDSLGLADPDTTNWFDDRLSFYVIATLNVVHHGFPFVAVTMLAGLVTLPQDTMEAATIDGAGAWRRFWYVTVPLLRPVFAVVTILSTIWDFKVFTQIFLMPGGNGTNRDVLNLGTWSYVTALSQNLYGLGAAIAVMLTLVLMVITAVYLRTMFRQEEL